MSSPFSASSRWNEALLQSARGETDPIADANIEQLLNGGDVFAVNKLFDTLVKNSDVATDSFPKFLQDYFRDTKQLPVWFDKKKIEIVQKLYAQFGPQVNMILICKSLPTCYACAKGAQVLHSTGRMSQHGQSLDKFTRRIMETAQFIVNSMEPGSFGPDGRAIRSMQKVRLMHASIRHYIQPHWNAEELGNPINQEDLLGTMLSMSFQIAEGLQQLAIDLDLEERNAFAHYGKVLGYMMGIKEEYLPETYDEAEECTEAILLHQVEASQAGSSLTEAAIDFVKDLIPGKVMDQLPALYTRHFIGDYLADLLEIDQSKGLISHLVIKQTELLNNLEEEISDRSELFGRVTQKLNMALLEGMINYFNDDKKVHFYIPPSLTENWKRTDIWNASWTSKELFNRKLRVLKKDSTIVQN